MAHQAITGMEIGRGMNLEKMLVVVLFTLHCAPAVEMHAGQAHKPRQTTGLQMLDSTPPGSARVAATIISIDTLNGQISITCLIDEILGYGAGSPVIIPKTTISAGIVPGFHYVIPEVKQSVVIDMRHIMRPDKGGKSQDVIWQITWIEPDGN